jgi:hypothetical protein
MVTAGTYNRCQSGRLIYPDKLPPGLAFDAIARSQSRAGLYGGRKLGHRIEAVRIDN